MHLALIEAMYKQKMIGRPDNENKGSTIGSNNWQITEESNYFVVGVEKDEWDIKSNENTLYLLYIYIYIYIYIVCRKNFMS